MNSFPFVEITTPQRFVLRGVWLGPRRPKRVVVWVHGIGGSLFSNLGIAFRLLDGKTAVLVFNNRGFARVAKIKREMGNASSWILAGAAHEKFTDCVDDIQGAVDFVRRSGVKQIFLAGHSTGCQKSVYWAYKKKGRGVKGIILLAPISDYAEPLKKYGAAKLKRAAHHARSLVAKGKPHEMMPASLWPEDSSDAQRFLSLYTPDSIEQSLFAYFDPSRKPRALRAVRKPIFVLLAEKDEHADRPAERIEDWFAEHLKIGDRIVIMPRVGHGFRGAERPVVNAVRRWMNSVR